MRLVLSGGMALGALAAVACGSFRGDDSPAGPSDVESPDAQPSVGEGGGAADAGTDAARCSGRRASLPVDGLARSLAADDRAVYWAEPGDGGGTMLEVTPDGGGTSFSAAVPDVRFTLPRSTSLNYVGRNPDGFCWFYEIDRTTRETARNIGFAGAHDDCDGYLFAGDETTLLAVSQEAFASTFQLRRFQPSLGNPIAAGQPATPSGMVTDGITAWVSFVGAYSAILAFRVSDSPRVIVQKAAAAGPIALLGDRIVWLTGAGELNSVPSAGGTVEPGVTVAGAKALAVGGDCVYVATSREIVAVDPSDGWRATPIAQDTAGQLVASKAGVFWTTTSGSVEAIWR